MTVIIYPTKQCHISKDSHFNGNVSELWYIEKIVITAYDLGLIFSDLISYV
jgi:hypothetical protein